MIKKNLKEFIFFMTKYLFFYSAKKNNIIYLKKIYFDFFFNLMEIN